MRKDIEKLIAEVTVLAIQVSNKTKHAVFTDYSGHVNYFQVYVFENGSSYFRIQLTEMYLKFYTNAEIKVELKKVKRKLEELKEEN